MSGQEAARSPDAVAGDAIVRAVDGSRDRPPDRRPLRRRRRVPRRVHDQLRGRPRDLHDGVALTYNGVETSTRPSVNLSGALSALLALLSPACDTGGGESGGAGISDGGGVPDRDSDGDGRLDGEDNCSCGGRLRLVAMVMDGAGAERYLRGTGLATDAHRARPPPSFHPDAEARLPTAPGLLQVDPSTLLFGGVRCKAAGLRSGAQPGALAGAEPG